MKEKVTLKPMASEHRTAVIDIFNYYIENTYAAYPEKPVGYEFYDLLLQAVKGYPALALITEEGEVIGFGFLRSFHPMPVFKRTAEISYFLKQNYVGNGLGQILLETLITEAKKIDIDLILASICSINKPSIQFHLKHGFEECGKFESAGKKKDRDIDILWMQKRLT
ncbi:MAG: L-methionine sulfoximine/L-methionine sulfone acetyltransferase [Candidatus Dichloromethanomonas elyunquensis]|nr:MAG: L-methionine sulfoximine/L-methionine sulfone acetyltransferase [Candidatus Dichloromethanomonas elyunquensis]